MEKLNKKRLRIIQTPKKINTHQEKNLFDQCINDPKKGRLFEDFSIGDLIRAKFASNYYGF